MNAQDIHVANLMVVHITMEKLSLLFHVAVMVPERNTDIFI